MSQISWTIFLSSAIFFLISDIKPTHQSNQECRLTRIWDLDNKRADFFLFQSFVIRNSSCKLECATECLKKYSCVTFIVDYRTRVCALLASKITRKDYLWDADGAVTYATFKAHNAHGSECISDQDCLMNNTRCSSSRCLCEPGWSYSPNELVCVRECQKYGRVFVGVSNKQMSVERKAIFTQAKYLSAQGCSDACLAATGFICLTFDLSVFYCKLYDVTSYRAPMTGSTVTNSYHYQRQCEYVEDN